MADARYVVGIDLGTTNCVLACVDTPAPRSDADAPRRAGARRPAARDAGRGRGARRCCRRSSICPAPSELPPESLALPWGTGGARRRRARARARRRGAGARRRVGEVVARARPASIRAADPAVGRARRRAAASRRSTPRRRTSRHLRAAWDAAHARAARGAGGVPHGAGLVRRGGARAHRARRASRPGSAARASSRSRRPRSTPGSPPRAARWREQVRVGDVVLVCDVGGGTTDLTLVAVGEEGGSLALERIAVGDHILLGGDNMDLALAHAVRARLADERHDARRLAAPRPGARAAATPRRRCSPPSAPDAGAGRRARALAQGDRRRAAHASSTRDEVERDARRRLLPGGRRATTRPQRRAARRPPGDRPAVRQRSGGHAPPRRRSSAAIARSRPTAPSAVLFNGGVMHADALPRRAWPRCSSRGVARAAPCACSPARDLDLAVARGAATYGLARRGRGVRIRGGTARAYYVGIETAAPAVPGMAPPVKALCVAPFGMEEGTEVELPGAEFGLVVGEPAEFRFFGSSVRRDDRPGHGRRALERGRARGAGAARDDARPATASAGRTVPVRLDARTSPRSARSSSGAWRATARERWKLEFNVRQRAG